MADDLESPQATQRNLRFLRYLLFKQDARLTIKVNSYAVVEQKEEERQHRSRAN